MQNQKILEIIVVLFSLLAIMFAIASWLFKDNLVIFRTIGIVCIVISFGLNIFSNVRKKKM